MRSILFLFLASIIISFQSCISPKELLNYQEDRSFPGADDVEFVYPLRGEIRYFPTIQIQPNDVLSIKVYSSDFETAAPFNLTPVTETGNFNTLESIRLSGYLVDGQGAVDFPILGKIYLKELSISEATDMFEELLKRYLKDPVVNIRLLNFSVTVSGEVNNQGVFTVFSDRISLPDALAMAGGLTDYANRTNILLVREDQGIRTLNRIDLTSLAFFKSEYYYLKQNDLIYVEPIRAKAGAVPDQTSKTIPIISATGALVAIIVALLKK